MAIVLISCRPHRVPGVSSLLPAASVGAALIPAPATLLLDSVLALINEDPAHAITHELSRV